MKNATTTIGFICALAGSSGCMYSLDPGELPEDSSAAATMEGVRVELIRHSAGCGNAESEGFIAEVGPGLEYPADVVKTIEAACPRVILPEVEVHVEDRAVVFDFSNVTEPGRFPEGEFEGYILDMVRTEDAPMLVAGAVDWNVTTIDVYEDDLRLDRDRLAVNLAGLEFDSTSMIKIDLYLTTFMK